MWKAREKAVFQSKAMCKRDSLSQIHENKMRSLRSWILHKGTKMSDFCGAVSQSRVPGRLQVLEAWMGHTPTLPVTQVPNTKGEWALALVCWWAVSTCPPRAAGGKSSLGEKEGESEGDSPAHCPGCRSRHRRRWCQGRMRRPTCCRKPGANPLWGESVPG